MAGDGSHISGARLVHEQLALQWASSAERAREASLSCAWFFLELTLKAMVEHLATATKLAAPRRARFSEQFHDDVYNLVAKLTSDIVCRQRDAPEMVERLNSALAFFLQDLLSVMDRGFVFSLIRLYARDVGSRMGQQGTGETLALWHLQLDFIRVVCSHEHYIPLNLPSADPTAEIPSLTSGAASPSPSVRSNDSQGSFVAHGGRGGLRGSGGMLAQQGPGWADLSADFRRKHFLVGLVVSLLSKALDQS